MIFPEYLSEYTVITDFSEYQKGLGKGPWHAAYRTDPVGTIIQTALLLFAGVGTLATIVFLAW